MAAVDTTRDLRYFLRYVDVALSVALCCLVVVVEQVTKQTYLVYHFAPVVLAFIVLRVIGRPRTAAWVTICSALLVQTFHLYLAWVMTTQRAMRQANPSTAQGIMLTLAWTVCGVFMGAQSMALAHRLTVSLISNALRSARLLLVYRISGEANALTMLLMNTIFYGVGFMGAVAGRRLTASCASLLNMLETLPAHAAAPTPASPDREPPAARPTRPSAELDAAGIVACMPGGQRVPTSPLASPESTSGSSCASSLGGRRVQLPPELPPNAAAASSLDALIRQTAQQARETMAGADAASGPRATPVGAVPLPARPSPLSPPPRLQLDVPSRPERAAASSSEAHETSPLSQASELSRERELLEAAFTPERLPAPLVSARIPTADLQLSSMLGKGAFGAVYKGWWWRPDAACSAAAGGAAGDAAEGGDGPAEPTSATVVGEPSAQRVAVAAARGASLAWSHRQDARASRGARPQRVAIKLIHRHHLEAEQLALFKRAASIELQLAPHENIVRL